MICAVKQMQNPPKPTVLGDMQKPKNPQTHRAGSGANTQKAPIPKNPPCQTRGKNPQTQKPQKPTAMGREQKPKNPKTPQM